MVCHSNASMTNSDHSFLVKSYEALSLILWEEINVTIGEHLFVLLQEFSGASTVTERCSRWLMERVQVICAGKADTCDFKIEILS